jgi:putative transcriptional regulator
MFTSLKNHFLIAMPSLLDPHFFRSVTYLCEHNEQGAVGIVINQPLLHLRLGDILEQMGIRTDYPEVAGRLAFHGGPVQKERGFILHNKGSTWQSTLDISENIALTTSPDILQAIAKNQGPPHTLIALGFASWAGGQLEKEMAENHWLYGPAHFDILFHMAIESRWRMAAVLMGVDVTRLSSDIGHA